MFKHTLNSNTSDIFAYWHIFQTITDVLSDWMVNVESAWE